MTAASDEGVSEATVLYRIPGDLLKAERNPDYHVRNQPHFDTLEIKGGGDAVSAVSFHLAGIGAHSYSVRKTS